MEVPFEYLCFLALEKLLKYENKRKIKIEKLLKETLKQDRAKTQVEGFTKLNLMELTRKHICAHNS